MRKRRMPDEKIAELVSEVDFETVSSHWMPQLEKCFHQVLKYEYYLNKIPDNLALPKYRKVVIRIVYRLCNQVHPSKFEFKLSVLNPDSVIAEFLVYLIEAELQRKQELFDANPVTTQGIRSMLLKLKREHEI